MRYSDISDTEIHNYHKLDKILARLCHMVIKGMKDPREGYYGMVAACVLDPDNRMVAGLNTFDDGTDTRKHAERVAIEKYQEQHGDIPAGSIIITTCSPCSEHMGERFGIACTELIDQVGVKKVYCGYMDPTQEEEHRDFNIMETENENIRDLCKQFAETFTDDEAEELSESKTVEYNGLTLRIKKPTSYELRVEALDDWGSKVLGYVEFDIGDGKELDPQDLRVDDKYQRQGIASTMYDYVKSLGYKIVRSWDQTDAGSDFWDKHRGQDVRVWENFHDGRHPEDKGDSKRLGVPTHASISTLRKVAKQGGRKGQLAHWMANMKSGRAKAKRK
jgi:pyrimidine deaminase RibD-like protein